MENTIIENEDNFLIYLNDDSVYLQRKEPRMATESELTTTEVVILKLCRKMISCNGVLNDIVDSIQEEQKAKMVEA